MSSPVLPDDPQLAVPAVVVPDRADAPISEITERFFRALLLKVPLDRIEELHLFSPLRQGGVETGIAVIAAREVIVPSVPEVSSHEPELSLDDSPHADAAVEAVEAVEDAGEAEDAGDAEAAEAVEDAEAVEAVAVETAPMPVVRHTVFTARYRLVQKGPERGKWEADVVAEAEAPLITVETVVRGVQRRAGEDSDTTRFTAAQIARALRLNLGAA